MQLHHRFYEQLFGLLIWWYMHFSLSVHMFTFMISTFVDHKRDASRAEDAVTLSFGADLIGMQRDWNEELQACREFPHQTLHERCSIIQLMLLHITSILQKLESVSILSYSTIFMLHCNYMRCKLIFCIVCNNNLVSGSCVTGPFIK